MWLFLAQNHEPMTHLPIATSILAALAALLILFVEKKELRWSWAVLTIVAFMAVVPTIATGIAAGVGRKYIEHGLLVTNIAENSTIRYHQLLGLTGAVLALINALLGLRFLRGKHVSKSLAVILALTIAIIWSIGAHLGGKDLWSPDTFPGYEQSSK